MSIREAQLCRVTGASELWRTLESYWWAINEYVGRVVVAVVEEPGSVCIVTRVICAFGKHTWVNLHHVWAQVLLCN